MVQHFLVKGRVQGVGFRWFVHREAAEIGLRGWVKNTDEGHVEIVAAGDAEQIEELRGRRQEGVAWKQGRCGGRARPGRAGSGEAWSVRD